MSSDLPQHLSIIMDGNGRWAKQRGLMRIKGHEAGSKSVRDIITAVRERNIPYLSLFVFSTENWQRPLPEVNFLMVLLKKYLIKERSEMINNGIRLRAIGDIERLPGNVQKVLKETEDMTRACTDMQLIVNLSYGGRWEITQAIKHMAEDIKQGTLDADAINESTVQSYLATHDIPDPDLLIRTSGEQRISNYMLWQTAYTELYFTPALWPDFTRADLDKALSFYTDRKRRFGKVA